MNKKFYFLLGIFGIILLFIHNSITGFTIIEFTSFKLVIWDIVGGLMLITCIIGISVNLEKRVDEWKRISGQEDLPRLNPETYAKIISPILNKEYSNDLQAYESHVIPALIDNELENRLKERHVKDLSELKELLQAYETVTEMNIESFDFTRGFNHSIFDKMGADRSEADKVVKRLKKELGLDDRTAYRLSQICKKFAPEQEKDFESDDYSGNRGIFVDNNPALKEFVEKIYPAHKELYDSLFRVQEQLYKRAEGVSKVYAFGQVPLAFLRPLVVYARQHLKKPYSDGGWRGSPNWDIKEVFRVT